MALETDLGRWGHAWKLAKGFSVHISYCHFLVICPNNLEQDLTTVSLHHQPAHSFPVSFCFL